MVMFLDKPRFDLRSSATGGEEATLAEIWNATDESMRLGENANSELTALDRAYDERIDAVKGVTGVELPNPVSSAAGPSSMTGFGKEPEEDPHAAFQRRLEELAAENEQHRAIIAPDRPVPQDAAAKMRAGEKRFEETWSRSSGGLMAWAARLGGGFYGAMHDPVNLFTLGLGPEGQAAKGAKGLLWMALKQGAANASTEAMVQPFVQQWRAKAGADHGFGQAAVNIAGAGLFGFAMDAGVRGFWRGGRQAVGRPYLGPEPEAPPSGPRPAGGEPTGAKLPGLPEGKAAPAPAPEPVAPRAYRGADPIPPMEALERAAREAPEGSLLRRAADGDEEAMAQLAKETGLDGDPVVRRALAEREIDKLFPTPLHVDGGEHHANLARQIREVSGSDDLPVGDAIAPAVTRQIADIADETVGRALEIEGRKVDFRAVDPRQVTTDASTFQFKSGGDVAGVTDRLRGVTRWDPVSAGKAIVFERADGSMVIADGHQRLGLAKRATAEGQDAKLDAYVFREADGWTPEDVRAYAALKNMRESSGTSVDMAQVMRDRPDLIDGSLPLTDAKLKEAVMLSRLSPEAFDAVVAGRLPPPFAALIGESVGDAARHAGLLDEMADAGLANTQQARLYLKQLMELPTTVETQMTLFGEESFTRTVLVERAQVLDGALRTLRTDKRIFGLLEDKAAAIEGAGNVLARASNAAKAQRAAELADLIEKLATSRGPVASVLNDAAASVARGYDPKLASRAFVDRIGDILEREGLPGLTRTDETPPPPLAPVRTDDPIGPEAKAQMEDVEAWLADAREAAERLDAVRAKTQTEIDLDDEIMFALRAKRYTAPEASSPAGIGDALKSLREAVEEAQTAPLTGRFAPSDLRARFIAYKKADTDLRAAMIGGLDDADALARYGEVRAQAESIVNDLRKTDARINRDIEKDIKADQAQRSEASIIKQIRQTTKIVGDDGEPLKLYHGTGHQFDRFEMDRFVERAVFLASDPSIAKDYDFKGKTPRVIEAYADIRNPKIIDAGGENFADATLGKAQAGEDDRFVFSAPAKTDRAAAFGDYPLGYSTTVTTPNGRSMEILIGLKEAREITFRGKTRREVSFDILSADGAVLRSDEDITVFDGDVLEEALQASVRNSMVSPLAGKSISRLFLRQIVDEARAEGHDGLWLRNGTDMSREPHDQIAVFDADQVRILRNTQEEGALFALRGFYSPAIRAAESISMKKGTGEQFWKQITKTPGVRKDELEWMGLEEFLKDKPSVTRDEVLGFMRAHQVELDEKQLTNAITAEKTLAPTTAEEVLPKIQWSEDWFEQADKVWSYRIGEEQYYITHGEEGWGIHSADGQVMEGDAANLAQAQHMLDGHHTSFHDDPGMAKFGDYKVPGGENYRELLIRLPSLGKRELSATEQADIAALQQKIDALPRDDRQARFSLESQIADIRNETAAKYTSKHFQDQEIVHLRVDDRTGPNGEKVLFINEVQSDLHQVAQRFGYGTEGTKRASATARAEGWTPEAKTESERLTTELRDDVSDTPENRAKLKRLDELSDRAEKLNKAAAKYSSDFGDGGAPEAPLKGELWLELALKRALLYAAENGYDAVSWSRSDQIAKAVGADPADLALQYDSKIGKFLDKYTKKWGAKVEEVRIPDLAETGKVDADGIPTLSLEEVDARFQATQSTNKQRLYMEAARRMAEGETFPEAASALFRDEGVENREVRRTLLEMFPKAFRGDGGGPANPILRITPEMRASVMEGQPLAYRGAQPQTPPRPATLHNTTLSTRAADEMVSIRAGIDEAVAKSMPPGWRAEVRQSLVFGDLSERIQKRNPGVPPSLEIEGTFDPYERIIYVSLAALDPVERAYEEAGHALKAMRLIPQADYAVLKAKAAEIGARQKFRIDERYGDVYGARWKDNPGRLEEALEEEAIMQMVAARARGDDFGKQSNTILDKLIKFLRAVRDMLGVKGFRTFEDVFEDMTEGGFARQIEAQRGQPVRNAHGFGGEVMAGGPGKTVDAAAGASVTQTPAFRKWFGDSKVVDAEGKPLVVYHGTDANIEAFDPAKLGEATDAPSSKMGFFFAGDPAVASSYASSFNYYKDVAFGRLANKVTGGWYEKANEALLRKLGLRSVAGGGENVLPVHLKLERPFEFDMKGSEYRERTFADIIDQAKREGHDGVVIRNTFDEGFEEGGAKMTDVYVVFDPTQIKSAIGNRGTFDPNDPRINFALPQSPAAEHDRFLAQAEAASEIMFALGEGGKKTKSPEAGGEPPVPAGKVRVYHSGAPLSATGESKRWVSTNRQYAKDYRKGQPLHYLDLDASDPRVNNADYPDQGVAQGFQFNFELSEAESGRLRQIGDVDSPASTGGAQAAAARSPSAPAKAGPQLPGGRESKRIRDLINQAAASGHLERKEADDLIQRYNTLEAFHKDGGKAKQQIAKEISAEAEHRKRQKALAETRRRQISNLLISFRDARGQADPAKAMQALIENLGQHELPQGFTDVAGHQRAIYGIALADLDAMLHEFRKTLITGSTRNKARLSNVVRELHGEATGDDLAAGFAQATAKVMEDLRLRFNAAGGNIAKRRDWHMPQSHDKVALLKGGKQAWVEFVQPLLDTKWMKHPLTGDDMAPADVTKTLGDVWDNLVSDGWHEREASMAHRGVSAIANTRADPRSLIFANADAWMKYSARFGSGDDALAIIVSHIRSMTKDIAAMEVLGPNPKAMLEYLKQFVIQQANLRRAGMTAVFPTHREITGIAFKPGSKLRDPVSYANVMVKRAENMWNVYSGAASAPESVGWAEVSRTIRNVNVATKLGGAAISGLGDLSWQVLARKFAGLPVTKMIGDIIDQIKPGGEREARRAGVIAETYLHMHNEGAREGAAWSATKVSGYVADRVLTLSMLNGLTRAGNHAMAMGIQGHLADMAGKRFADLDPRLQRMFRRWGLAASDWDIIRLDASGQPHQVDFLAPADIRRRLIESGGDPSIAERYLGMTLGEAQYATLTGSIRGQAMMYGNLQAGTAQRELWSMFLQFKSFAVNLAILQLGRIARESVSQGFSRGAQYAAWVAAITLLGGAFVEQIQQLRNGKDPRDMRTAEFWGAAAIRSGGLSIWGDLLYASQNRMGGGVASTIAGPSASTLNDILNLTYGSARKALPFTDSKEKTNFGRELSNLISRNTPGASLWYVRTAWERVLMDNLQRMLDPEAEASFRRKLQNARRDYKQEFWWKPGGGPVPQRGPRLDAMFGAR